MAMLVAASMLGLTSATFLVIALIISPAQVTAPRALTHLGESVLDSIPVAVELDGSFHQRVSADLLLRTGRLLQRLTPEGVVRSIALKLERAGNPRGMMVAQYLGVCVCSAALFTVLAAFFHRSGLLYPSVNTLVSGLIAFIGFILPDYWVQGHINARDLAIRRALPDSIDILVACAEAGLSLDQGLAELISRRRGPLTDEFDRVLKEIALGKGRNQAWRDLADRAGGPAVKSFASAIYQAEELGTSIATVLRVQSETSRMQRSLEVRVLAGKLPVKMLFPLIFFIFPAMFCVVLGPAMVSIYQAITVLK